MKLLLLKIARVPLLLAAMLVGFAEIARGPAGVGADIYRDGDLVAQSAVLDAQTALDAQSALDVQAERVRVAPATSAPAPQIPEPTEAYTWSDRLRDLAAGEERLTVFARHDDRGRDGIFASASSSIASRHAALAP